MSETWHGWGCGDENGEFHTLVDAGPMFDAPIEVKVGEVRCLTSSPWPT